MRDTIRGEDHAVAAARLDGHWLMLDNRRMAMIEDAACQELPAAFVIDQYGVMQYADAPLLANAGPGYCAVAEFGGPARLDFSAELIACCRPGRSAG